MQLQRNERIDTIIFRYKVITWSSRPPTLYVAQSRDAGEEESAVCVCVWGGGGGGGGAGPEILKMAVGA